jgi:hypothetical protein
MVDLPQNVGQQHDACVPEGVFAGLDVGVTAFSAVLKIDSSKALRFS